MHAVYKCFPDQEPNALFLKIRREKIIMYNIKYES